jgi:hypothetical protein
VHRSRGVWNADLIGYPGYPKTKEAFEAKRQKNRERFLKWSAEGRLPNRRGMPNGFAGSREEMDRGRAKARAEAKEIIEKMKRKTLISSIRAQRKPSKLPLRSSALKQWIHRKAARTTSTPRVTD